MRGSRGSWGTPQGSPPGVPPRVPPGDPPVPPRGFPGETPSVIPRCTRGGYPPVRGGTQETTRPLGNSKTQYRIHVCEGSLHQKLFRNIVSTRTRNQVLPDPIQLHPFLGWKQARGDPPADPWQDRRAKPPEPEGVQLSFVIWKSCFEHISKESSKTPDCFNTKGWFCQGRQVSGLGTEAVPRGLAR